MKKTTFVLLFLVFLCPKVAGKEGNDWNPGDTIQLNTVTVTNQLQEAVSTRQFLLPNPTGNIDAINERVPGITTISRGPFAREPGVAGFTGGQINVTIDGMKMFGACTDKMDPITSYVEPVNLKAINYPAGAGGALYGSTFGGSYNMQLQTPQLNAFEAGAGTSYESASNGVAAFARLNYGKEKWAWRVSGVYRNFNAYLDGNGEVVPYTQYRKWNLHNSLLYQTQTGHSLTLDVIVDDAYDVGYPALPMDVALAQGRIFSLSYAAPATQKKLRYLSTKMYANTVYHLMDDSQRDSLFMVENQFSGQVDSVYMRMDMPGWSQTYGAFVQANWVVDASRWFTFKLENYTNWSKAEMTMFMHNVSNPGEPPMFVETWPENLRNVAGLFSSYNHQWQNLVLEAGVRVDVSASKLLTDQGVHQFEVLGYDVRKTYVMPVYTAFLSADWSLASHTGLAITAGLGQRLPTLSEQFGFYLFNAQDGYDYIGNPDLKSEKAAQLQCTYSLNKKRISIQWQNQVHLLRDYIYGEAKHDYGPLNLYASGVKQYVNKTSATTFSSTAQVMVVPVAGVELMNMFQYYYGEIDGGQAMPMVAPVKNRLAVTYRKPAWYLQLENESSAAQNRIDENFGETPTAGYALFHLRGGYALQTQKINLKLDAGIENLTNRAYSEHLDWGSYLRTGRNLVLAVTIKY